VQCTIVVLSALRPVSSECDPHITPETEQQQTCQDKIIQRLKKSNVEQSNGNGTEPNLTTLHLR